MVQWARGIKKEYLRLHISPYPRLQGEPGGLRVPVPRVQGHFDLSQKDVAPQTFAVPHGQAQHAAWEIGLLDRVLGTGDEFQWRAMEALGVAVAHLLTGDGLPQAPFQHGILSQG